jgi:hypothetical protein
MTTTIDRAEINRRNAAKSTGPRTPGGKARPRFNAVKHGCRARLPILPGEDPDAYHDRLDAWLGKFAPRDAVELYLVERAVLASWQLDRADRAEVARLVAEADKEAARQAEDVADVGAELFRAPARGIGRAPDPAGDDESLLSWPCDPDHPEYPAHRIADLEATAAGCSWLLDRWAELAKVLDAGRPWHSADRLRAIRLLGKQPLEVIADPQVRAIYLAGQAMDPDGPDVFAEPLSDLRRPEMEAARERLAGKLAAARAGRAPRDAAGARATLKAIVAAAVARVAALREVRAAAEAAGLADISARLSHSGKEAVEWLRKHQATCSRALYRTFAELHKLRRDFGDDPAWDEEPAERPASGPCAELAPASAPFERNRSTQRDECGPAAPRRPGSSDGGRPTSRVECFLSAPGPEALVPEEAEATRDCGPCDVVEPDALPPTGPGPVAVEPVGERGARDVTNEASDPPASLAPDAEPDDRARTVTNEATGPAISRPSDAADDDAGDVTNKANRPAEGAARPVAAGPAVLLALLAPLFCAGVTSALRASAQARDPSRIATQERRTGGGPASSRAREGWPHAPRSSAREDVVLRPEDDHPVRLMSPDDNDVRNQPIRIMEGKWCGPGFQRVSRPSCKGKVPVPRAGRHQFPPNEPNLSNPKCSDHRSPVRNRSQAFTMLNL